MIRNIQILTFTLLFVVSTTGIPLTIHYCKMMETSSALNCEMHTKEKSSCCQDDSGVMDECCQNLLVDNSVKEIFISLKTEIITHFTLIAILDKINSEQSYTVSQNNSNFLLPETGNKVFLINSVLLI
jgi:hypothetical protein